DCVRRDIVKANLYDIRRVLSDWIADTPAHPVPARPATEHADDAARKRAAIESALARARARRTAP
ncbi:hypothetical protein LPZ50_08965, partial [Bordetella petrii]|nr:hypothetical protein [Bordetella petrii]